MSVLFCFIYEDVDDFNVDVYNFYSKDGNVYFIVVFVVVVVFLELLIVLVSYKMFSDFKLWFFVDSDVF